MDNIKNDEDEKNSTGSICFFYTNKLKTNLIEMYNFLNDQIKNFNFIELGFIYSILILTLVQLTTAILNYNTFLIVYIYNLIKLFMTIFCIFSFYTWLNLIYGKRYNLNDKNIYFLFLTCFLSEFIIQFTVYNTDSARVINEFSNLNRTEDLIQNSKNILIISIICSCISYCLNLSLFKENLKFILLICLTRFYGSVYFSEILPYSICSYFTYFCAFGGVLFSHYINSIDKIDEKLRKFNSSLNLIERFKSKNDRKINSQASKKRISDKYDTDNSSLELYSDASIDENLLKSTKNRRKLISSSLLCKRRTSLPTNIPLKAEKQNNFQNSLLNDIQRILDNLLADEEFKNTKNLLNGVKTIKNLINHSNLLSQFVSQTKEAKKQNNIKKLSLKSFSINHHNLALHSGNTNKYYNDLVKNEILTHDYTLPNLAEINSYSADEDEEKKHQEFISINNNSHEYELKQVKFKNRRSLPAQFHKRLSGHTCTCSTTTSATGLPIDLPCPRQRSLSLKCHSVIPSNYHHLNINKSENFYKNSNKDKYDLNEIETNSDEKEVLNSKENKNGMSLYHESKILQKKIFEEEDEYNRTGGSVNSNDSCQNKTSDYESGESPTNSDYQSDTDKLHLKTTSDIVSYHHEICTKKLEQIREEFSNSTTPSISLLKNSNSDKELWQPEDLKDSDLLNYLNEWSFPIFRFYEQSNHFVISQMAYKIFDEVGLFKTFDIPVNPFIQYFTALERGYIDLPYHNKIHAADVLHACYYLTTQAVPGLIQVNDSSPKISKERIPLTPYQYSLKYSLTSNETYGCLGANFTPLELLALYCSAAMHDYEHPGRNNQFLVSINSPLALLYNDRSVLENHHASSSWLLLKSNPKYNFLTGLDQIEWKKFRFLILEYILATDLSKHFSLIAEFNKKAKVDTSRIGVLKKQNIKFEFESGLDWTCESDRLLCGQMILKLADINAPLKEKELHLQWTNRIVQEFYQQGDEELSLGLVISPFMDRKKPQVAKLQENFINNLVGSLCNAFTHAGLLPGLLVDDSENKDDSNEVNNLSPNNLEFKPKFFYSELLCNFKSNYDMWCVKVKEEESFS